MRSDICEQGQTSKPLRVGKIISTGEVVLTEEGGDLLLQVAHKGQHGSMTQPIRPLYRASNWEGEKNGRRRHRTPNFLEADLARVEI